MPPDLSETPELMEIRRAATDGSLRARARWIMKMRLHRAYRAVFFDEDGMMTDAARIVLEDLSDHAGLGMATAGLEHEELAAREGERRLMLHLFSRFRLNEAEMANLEREWKKDRS